MTAQPIICENTKEENDIQDTVQKYIEDGNNRLDCTMREDAGIVQNSVYNLSIQDQEQFDRIEDILSHTPVNVNSLRNIAHHGFISKQIRRYVWPQLIGIGKENVLYDLHVPNTIDINGTYYDQINKDIIRSCCHFDINEDQNNEEISWLRKSLARQLHSFFGSHTTQHYIQGFHDIASIMMFLCIDKYVYKIANNSNTSEQDIFKEIPNNLKQYHHIISVKNFDGDKEIIVYKYDESLAYAMIKRIALSYLKDSLCSTQDRVTQTMQLLFPLIGLADEQVGDFLDESCVNFAFSLPWILTWMAHNIPKYDEVCLVFDLLLSSHPLMSLYFCAAAILLHKDEMLQLEPDTFTVHQFMQHMPEHLNVRITLLLCRVLWITYPPDILLRSQQSEVGKPHDVHIELPKDSPLYFRTPADIITYIQSQDNNSACTEVYPDTKITNEPSNITNNHNSASNVESTPLPVLNKTQSQYSTNSEDSISSEQVLNAEIPPNASLSQEVWGTSIAKYDFIEPLISLPSCNDIIMENGELSSVLESEEASTITDVNSDVYIFGKLFPQLLNALYEDERFIPLLHSIHTSYDQIPAQDTSSQHALQRILYKLFPIQDPIYKKDKHAHHGTPLRDIRDFTSAILAFPVLLSYLFSNQLLMPPEIRDVAQRSAVSQVTGDLQYKTHTGNDRNDDVNNIGGDNESSGALLWNPYLLKAKISNSDVYDASSADFVDIGVQSSIVDDIVPDINLPTSNSGQTLDFVVKPRPFVTQQPSNRKNPSIIDTIVSTVSNPLHSLFNLLPNSTTADANIDKSESYQQPKQSSIRYSLYIAGIIGGIVAQYAIGATSIGKKSGVAFADDKFQLTFAPRDRTP